MPVDYQQLQDIHRLEGEVDQAKSGVKQLAQSRVDLIEGLPEYVRAASCQSVPVPCSIVTTTSAPPALDFTDVHAKSPLHAHDQSAE